jgi:heat shock protein HtpX
VKRKSFGRDAGLTFRMLLTTALLGLLYVIFAVVLLNVLNVGLVPMLVIVIGIAVFQYWTSDKLALAAAGAKIVSEEEAPELHATIARLCTLAGLPMPRVAIVPSPVPNAFATGRNPKHAAVAVTQGLMQRLEPQEIEAVLAHELSHVANRDVLIMTLASFFAMLAALITRWGLYFGMFGGFGGGGNRSNNSNGNNQIPVWLIVFVVAVVTYAISFVLIRTLSRYREYAADRGSALMTGAPENLMSALQKIATNITQIPQQDLREVAGMNAFFIVPTNWRSHVGELFMDHPPMEKRLAALSQIAREMGRPVA